MHSCHNNLIFRPFWAHSCPLVCFQRIGVEGLDEAVCWGQHARNSIFSENPLSLYNSLKDQINVWSFLQGLYLVFVFNCAIVFCHNRTKFCFVCQLFFHSQTSSYLQAWFPTELPADCGTRLVLICFYCLLANHIFPFSENIFFILYNFSSFLQCV